MSAPQDCSDDASTPSKSLLKRIDIGLTTGICAVFISFLALLVARHETAMMLETQKASVLPIIDIDLGYIPKLDEQDRMKQYFEVRLSNVGAGIAHIQKVSVLKNGELLENYTDFENAIMTPRMRGWATLYEKPAAGYLRAGESVLPASYNMGAAESDLSAYLRGQWGVPLEGVDISVCYCSVFNDCWTVQFLDRKTPKTIEQCGIDDSVFDSFMNYSDQRAQARQK